MPCLCSRTKSRAPHRSRVIDDAASTPPVVFPTRQSRNASAKRPYVRDTQEDGTSSLFPDGVVEGRTTEFALVSIVFCSHAQDHSIDSFVGLRSGEKLPATAAATGMKFTLLHIDVVEAEIVILSSHDWSRRWPSAWDSKSLISRGRFRRRLGCLVSLSLKRVCSRCWCSSLKLHSAISAYATTGNRPDTLQSFWYAANEGTRESRSRDYPGYAKRAAVKSIPCRFRNAESASHSRKQRRRPLLRTDWINTHRAAP